MAAITACTAAANESVCPGVLRTVEINRPSDITGVAAVGSLAVTADNHGLTTWDLSDPTTPHRIGSWVFGRGFEPQAFFRMGVELDPLGKWACLTPTFTCFDLREPQAPQPFEWPTDGWPNHWMPDDVHPLRGTAINKRLISARHAPFGSRYSDIWFLDRSRPGPYEWIKPDAFHNRFMHIADLAFTGDHLLVLDMIDGLIVFDVSSPDEPRELASIDLSNLPYATGRLFAGDNVAVAVLEAYPQDSYTIDLTNPE